LHGAWTRGVAHLAGGEDELVEFLLERVRAHGGDTRLADRATGLVHKGGKVRGVHIDGDEAPVGVTFVVSDLPTTPVLDLARDFARSGERNEKTPTLTASENRFVVSLVVKPEGVPRPLATESFLLPAKGNVVHLQKAPGAAEGTVLLVAEAILPEGASLARAREDVLATIIEFLPFVEKHALVCDSPHDGRPLWDFRKATPGDPAVGPASWALRAQSVDRSRLRVTGGSLEPEPMVPRFVVTPPQLHGLAGEPIRTALGNVFVTGRSTLPALGQEGELLAAWGVARVITRTDRRKEKMLREMWS
jgi:phytoene dehydrogenase-like protein